MTKKLHFERSDVEALISEAREFDTVPAEYASRLYGAHSLIERLTDALDLSLSVPADERVHNHGAEDGPGLACNESVAPNGRRRGACMPVAPEPVYEYGVVFNFRADAEAMLCRSLQEAKNWADEFGNKGTLAKRIKSVPAGEWGRLPVVSTSKEQGDD